MGLGPTTRLKSITLRFVAAIWLLAGLQAAMGGSDAMAAPIPAGDSANVKVWVQFRDKGPGKRPLRSLDYENLPIHEPYLRALVSLGFACDARLKWQNRVSGRIARDLLPRLASLPPVASVSPLARKLPRPVPRPGTRYLPWNPRGSAKAAAQRGGAADTLDYGPLAPVLESLQVQKVHALLEKAGKPPGRGVRIAVIDADFLLGHSVFAPLFAEGRIRDQWDFVENRPQAVTRDLGPSHGANCLSLLAGNLPGTLVGLAPAAEYLLYRAEDESQERYVEEDYVAAAIERAVDSGAQVINISLSYRFEYSDGSPDLPYMAMDGRTRPSSLAALGAARRNVLVAVAVGNLPDSLPRTPSIEAPGDADSILAVGIADHRRRKCSYACRGPTADGRIKPDVVTMGLTEFCFVPVVNPGSQAGLSLEAGTSFASPVVAGIAALLWQALPNPSAQKIRSALMASAHLGNRPDDSLGFGLVDALAALQGTRPVLPGSALAERGAVKVYHAGGRLPLELPYLAGAKAAGVQVHDLAGRRVRVKVGGFGARMLLEPFSELSPGIYIISRASARSGG